MFRNWATISARAPSGVGQDSPQSKTNGGTAPKAIPPFLLTKRAHQRVSEANPAEGWGPDSFAGGAGRARALPDC